MRLLKITFTIAVLGVFLLVGCSSRPSESDGRAIIEKQIQDQSGGLIKLVDFKKTNGQEGEVMGVKVYTMDYQATIEFTSDCYWDAGLFGDFEAVAVGKPRGFTIYFCEGKAGQQVTVSGKLQFEKTEKGWRCEMVSVDHPSGC